MRHARLVALCIILPVAPASAQDSANAPEIRLDGAIGVGSSRHTLALSLTHQFGVLSQRRLRLGYGLRYSHLGGERLGFRTSDRGQLGGGPVDRVDLEPNIHALNAEIHIGYRIGNRVEAGFNIDLLGVGFGPDRTFDQSSSGGSSVTGSPSSFNLLRLGRRDRGSLDSEFYLALAVSPRLVLRGGLSHYVAEYETDQPLSGGSDRVRSVGNLVFAALTYRWRI